MDTIAPNVAANLKSGFRKCGIVPLNAEELLSRIPWKVCSADDFNASFLQISSARRKHLPKTIKTRREKSNIPPGKSGCLEDEEQESETVT